MWLPLTLRSPSVLTRLLKLDGCTVLNEHNTVFASNRSAICNRRFLGPTQVFDANGISIAAAVLLGSLDDRPTDRPTDHAIRSVTIGGARSGEAKFCYCLRLQQVLYWSNRLHRSDQIQQSAAIFSCKTTLLAK